MNKISLWFAMIFLVIASPFMPCLSFGQSPEAMTYQAVIRDNKGLLIENQQVRIKVSLLKGSENGNAVYIETQKTLTNANGLLTLKIGTGESSGDFSSIDWSDGPFFIKTETDPSGGTNYTITGVSQLLSVPYALHAKTVEIDKVDDADADPTNEIQTLSKTGNTVILSKNGGSFTDAVDDADADPANEIQTLTLSGTNLTLSKNGGTVTLPSSGGGDNWGTQTVATNATIEGNGSTASPLKIAQQGATTGQALKWNGSAWVPGNDAKEDSTNEIQTLSLSGTSLTLSKNGGTVTLPSSGGGDNWGTQTVATNATLEGNGSIASPLKIAQQGATTGQALKWNGSAWAPGNDAEGAGLTLPYSDSISYSRCGFSIFNSLGMGIMGESSDPFGTGVFGGNSSNTGYPYGVVGFTSSPNGISVYAENTSSGYGVFGSSVSGTGIYGKGEISGVYGRSSNGSGVRGATEADHGSGVFGAGTGKGSSSGVVGDAGESVSPPQPGNSGVLGQANEHIGVAGTAVSGIGGYFSSQSGLALQTIGGIKLTGIGEAAGKVLTSDGNGNATWQTASSELEFPYHQTTSTDDNAFWISNDQYTAIRGTSTVSSGAASGVWGEANSYNGYGVFGLNLATSGYSIGVRGTSCSQNGYGVYGTGDGAGVFGRGSNYGVFGESSSSEGAGVYGLNETNSNFGIGVRGEAKGQYGYGVYATGKGVGVYGSSDDGNGVMGSSDNGYAGYFAGRVAVSGNAGIGTTTPNAAYQLDVNGETNTGAININCDGKAITCNGNEAVWYNGDHFSWGYGCVWNVIDKKVFIGPGSVNPGDNMLVVNGTAAKPGGGSWATWSDIRLKDIQGNYEKGLKEIIALKPVKFKYKAENACNLPSDQNYVGFIAQDVQKIFPEAVSEDKEGYLSLDVNSINVALVNAIKELKAENDELKARLDRLEKLMEANGIH